MPSEQQREGIDVALTGAFDQDLVRRPVVPGVETTPETTNIASTDSSAQP